MKAASSGPSAEPGVAADLEQRLREPVLAAGGERAMRDDSGWKTDEPTPISAAAASTDPESSAAIDSSSRPHSVKLMPMASEYGVGRRSV